MTNAIQPFHLLVIALAGWLNRVWCKYSNGLYDIVIKRYYG